jgi:hypothetical protein
MAKVCKNSYLTAEPVMELDHAKKKKKKKKSHRSPLVPMGIGDILMIKLLFCLRERN